MLLGNHQFEPFKKKKKMARSDTCPQGPPSFPGQGRQRIPQIKVILGGAVGGVGVGIAQDNTFSRSVVGDLS